MIERNDDFGTCYVTGRRLLALTAHQLPLLNTDYTFVASRLPAAFCAAGRIRFAHQLQLALAQVVQAGIGVFETEPDNK